MSSQRGSQLPLERAPRERRAEAPGFLYPSLRNDTPPRCLMLSVTLTDTFWEGATQEHEYSEVGEDQWPSWGLVAIMLTVRV